MKSRALNTGELFDIEPLIAPGVDWVFWFEVTLLTVAGLLVLLVMLYLLRFLYRPLLFKWQLARLVKKVSKNQTSFSKAELFTFYDWLTRYRAWLKSTEQDIDNVQLNALIEQADRICFSNQVVSRETYLNVTTQAQRLVKSPDVFADGFSKLKKSKLGGGKWK